MRLFCFLFSFCFVIPLTTVFAQDKSPVVASTPSTLASDLETYIEKARQEWQVPGLAVAVVKDDAVILSKGFGQKQAGVNDAVDADTLFAIASNSKAFTAAALAILVDEGKLKWDDHVRTHLPWFKLKDQFASNDIRVRDLLCHRSGLGTFSGDLLWWGTPYTPKEILERAALLEPASPFRSNFGYSNLMFLAAGEVITAVSGKTWPEFVRERIVVPLEMKRTVFSVRDLPSAKNFAIPHKTYLDHSQPIEWMNWDAMGAAGGVISSANDMSQWLRLQLRQGELSENKRLFSLQQSHEMWQSQTPIRLSLRPSKRFPSTHFKSYGLGWALSDYRGFKVVGHGGGYDGMYSQVLMVPEQKIGVVVLTNSMTGISEMLAYHVIDRILGGEVRDWSSDNLADFRKSRVEFNNRITKATTAVVADTKPSHPIADYTGKFRCPMYGDASVQLEGTQLIFRLAPYPALVAELKHLHYDTFEIRWKNQFAWFEGGTAHFVADAKGKFQSIELDVPNDDLWFHEIKLKRVAE